MIIIVLIVTACKQDKDRTIETKSIRGINTESNNDNFVLGIKGIQTDSIFNTARYYIYIQKDNGYLLESLYVNDTEIIITSGEPYIEGYFQDDGTIFKFDLDIILSYELDTIEKYSKYKLYLPENYIIKDIVTELKE